MYYILISFVFLFISSSLLSQDMKEYKFNWYPNIRILEGDTVMLPDSSKFENFNTSGVWEDSLGNYGIMRCVISQFTNKQKEITLEGYCEAKDYNKEMFWIVLRRNSFNKAHPYLFKFTEKDTQHSNQYGDQNVIIYRYGELLIMLAEISNELNNGEQLGYINELLSRVGMTPQMGYYGSQDEFRNAVMYEYRFEVLGEGEDAHNNRRRGFDYFLNNTILFHNYNPLHNPAVDLTLSEDESQVMNLLIPLVEINSNNLID